MSHRHPPSHRHPVEPGVRLKGLLAAMAALPMLAIWWWAATPQAMPAGLRYTVAVAFSAGAVAWAAALGRQAPCGSLAFHEGQCRWLNTASGPVRTSHLRTNEPVTIELRVALDVQVAVLLAVRPADPRPAEQADSGLVKGQPSPRIPRGMWLFAGDVSPPAWLALRRCLAANGTASASGHAAPAAPGPLA